MEESFPRMISKHCEVHYYCGRDHQVKDHSTHKGTCKTFKGSKAKVTQLEAQLRFSQGGGMPADVLGTDVGNFCRWPARQGIEDALNLYLSLLRPDHDDRQGARFLIPVLYIRLGRDQEAYDFCKAGPTNSLAMRAARSKRLVRRYIERLSAEVFATDESMLEKRVEFESQLGQLWHASTEYNKYFRITMFEPEQKEFSTGPRPYSPGSDEKAHLAFMHTYGAWCKTPMAIANMRRKVYAAINAALADSA
ncbi:hypothetical protein N0V88_007886 [Collariella sp. IMI 366227]|nr:hypothetical protein N0V88_007886 [Collariella sp. IMI 366227]